MRTSEEVFIFSKLSFAWKQILTPEEPTVRGIVSRVIEYDRGRFDPQSKTLYILPVFVQIKTSVSVSAHRPYNIE